MSIVLGIAVSALVSRSLRSLLFGVSPTDVATYALVALLLPLPTGRARMQVGIRQIARPQSLRRRLCAPAGGSRGRLPFHSQWVSFGGTAPELERGSMLKPRPNHRLYIQILRRMSPEQRLRKAFELGDLGREMFRHGLRRRHPELPADELRALEQKRLEKCHNRSY